MAFMILLRDKLNLITVDALPERSTLKRPQSIHLEQQNNRILIEYKSLSALNDEKGSESNQQGTKIRNYAD